VPDHPAGEVEVDPSAAPWRALEDGPVPPIETEAPATHLSVPRSAIAAGLAALALAVGAFLLAFGVGSGGGVVVVDGASSAPGASADISPGGAGGGSQAGRLLVVEIVGAVGHPGVFRLPADARVGDLVAAAGGFGPRVDTDRAARELNLAAVLRDGDQIRVPSRDDAPPSGVPDAEEAGAGGTSGGSAVGPGAPISLARATAAELDTLPGIGPVTAAKIIASREGQPFAAVEDLRTRKLVGDKTFEKLKGLVTVP
jgi:competence protein ComEA